MSAPGSLGTKRWRDHLADASDIPLLMSKKASSSPCVSGIKKRLSLFLCLRRCTMIAVDLYVVLPDSSFGVLQASEFARP